MWIERLGSDESIPALISSARRGRQYAYGGAITRSSVMLAPGERVEPSLFLPSIHAEDLLPGEYRLVAEYRKLHSDENPILQSRSVRFTVTEP